MYICFNKSSLSSMPRDNVLASLSTSSQKVNIEESEGLDSKILIQTLIVSSSWLSLTISVKSLDLGLCSWLICESTVTLYPAIILSCCVSSSKLNDVLLSHSQREIYL